MDMPAEKLEKEEIGQRLREERTRLRMTLPAMGDVGGVQKNAQLAYEKGERMPDAQYLRKVWRNAYVDIQYVLTGQRERKTEELSLSERALLDRFGLLSEENRETVERVLLLAVDKVSK